MARQIAETCDLCGQYRAHAELITLHAAGEPVDVCHECQARPVADVLTAAQRIGRAQAEGPVLVT